MSTNGFSDLPRFEDPIRVLVLKVHINCEGCKHRVKKLLRKIEGVYKVDIDTEQHKVSVTGSVDSDVLIKKLEKSGKHAEIWPPNNCQIQPNQEQAYADWIKNGMVLNQIQGPIKGLRGSQRPMMGPPCGPEVNDESAYYQNLNQDTRRGQHPIMANTVMDNVLMGAIDGYNMDGDRNMHGNMNSMMGFQGFSADDAGLPSFEHHHPQSYMMSNIRGPQYGQQFPMMNTMMNMDIHDMQPMNIPMMNHYMHVMQPQRTIYATSPFTPNQDYGNFSHVPYMANM